MRGATAVGFFALASAAACSGTFLPLLPEALDSGPVTDASGPSIVPSDSQVDASRQSYAEAVLADRPLLYLRLGGGSPGSAKSEIGATECKIVGAVESGKPGALSGESNAAFGFSNPRAFLNCGPTLDFPGRSPFTYEFWVLNSGLTLDHRHVFTKQGSTDPIVQKHNVYVRKGEGIVFERVVDDVEKKIAHLGDEVDVAKVFAYVAVTYDGRQLAMYVNGELKRVLSDEREAKAKADDFVIGASLRGHQFLGDLDEIAIYGKALSGDTIARHFALAKR